MGPQIAPSSLASSPSEATHLILDPSLPYSSSLAEHLRSLGKPVVSPRWAFQSFEEGRTKDVEEFSLLPRLVERAQLPLVVDPVPVAEGGGHEQEAKAKVGAQLRLVLVQRDEKPKLERTGAEDEGMSVDEDGNGDGVEGEIVGGTGGDELEMEEEDIEQGGSEVEDRSDAEK